MRVYLVLFSFVFLVACQSEDSATPTSLVLPDTTQSQTLIVPQDTGSAMPQQEENLILQDNPEQTQTTVITTGYDRLVGSWTTKARRATIISIYSDGRLNIEAEGWPTVNGTFTMRGNRLSMQTNSDLMCQNVVGIYDVYYSPDWNTLFFEKIQDNCDMRGRRLRKSFTRVSDTPGVDPSSITTDN